MFDSVELMAKRCLGQMKKAKVESESQAMVEMEWVSGLNWEQM